MITTLSWMAVALVAGSIFGFLVCDRYARKHAACEPGDDILFRELVEGSLTGVLVVARFKILYANSKAADIFGYRDARALAAIDSALDSLVAPEDRQRVREVNLQRMKDPAMPLQMEFRGMHRSGHLIWIESQSHAVEWQGQQAYHVAFTDISERKRAEAALQESERRFRNVFNQQFQFMAILDPEGIILSVNDLSLRGEGVTGEDYVGKPFWLSLNWKNLPDWQAIVKSQVETSKSMNVPLFTRDKFERGNGEIGTVQAAYTAIRDERGAVEYILVQASDITSAMLTEQSLQESNQRMSLAMQSASMGTWEWDVVNDRVAWSPETYRIFGADEQSFTGDLAAYLKFTDPRDIADLESLIGDFLETATPGDDLLQYQHRIVREDGSRGWIEVNGKLFFTADGKPQKMTGVCVDISRRKHEEREIEQKNLELERFNYTVSHELKTPLVTINGYLGMLERHIREADEELIGADIKVIAAAVETMGRQLDDLLDLSRIGRITHPWENIPMAEFCQAVIDELAVMVEGSNARIVIDAQMPDAFADPVRIREVIQNLVDNAIKFSLEVAQPEITISGEAAGDWNVYRVRDNGPGIEARFQLRVFELFDRLDAKTPGTGIGLTIVKRIIEVHGGSIWVESEGAGKGTCMCFSLPARNLGTAQEAPPISAAS